MGCIYSNSDCECSIGHPIENGAKDNTCVYDDDPNPADSCDQYESDWTCSVCGGDMNVDECNCEDE